MYIPYALLTLEKSLLTIKSIVKSLKIDPESTLQHLTLGPSTPGKFWIWAWYLSPCLKKRTLYHTLCQFLKKIISSTNCIIQTNDSLMFKCISKYKILYTNKQRTLSISALISPPNINALCLGLPKRGAILCI